MTPALFVVAASCGALARQLVHQCAVNWRALLVVNVVGSFVLGFVIEADVSQRTATVLGVAFCGSLTTFSGFALELRHQPMRQAIAFAALRSSSMASQKAASKGASSPTSAPSTGAAGSTLPAVSSARASVS